MKSIIKIVLFQLILIPSLLAQKGSVEYGLASFYSDKFHGKKTANGALYDMSKMTGAHKTLPFGTVVKVTRLDNKNSVRVVINDRGPFISDRIVEVSKAAAKELGLIKDGIARVKLEVVNEKESAAVSATKPAPPTKTEAKPKNYEAETAAIAAKKELEAKKAVEKVIPPAKTATNPVVAAAEPAPKKVAETTEKAKSKATLVQPKNYQTYDLYKIELLRPERKGYGVQVASLTNYENVFKKIAELQGQWFNNIMVSVEKGADDQPVYKIILGQFEEEAKAQAYKESLKKKNKMQGFVINLDAVQDSGK